MTTIGNVLRPDHIKLRATANEPDSAIKEVAILLKGEPGGARLERPAEGGPRFRAVSAGAGGWFALCIPHTRGECVSAMVMSAGRFEEGIVFPSVEFPVRYIFCIAVPRALAADYLRIVGPAGPGVHGSRGGRRIARGGYRCGFHRTALPPGGETIGRVEG